MANVILKKSKHRWKYYAAAQVVLVIGLLMTSVGTVVMLRAHAQYESRNENPEVVIERLTNKEQDQESRLRQLEELKIAQRLAVAESDLATIKTSIDEVRKLVYGTLAAILVALTAQLIQVRGMKKSDIGDE